jgi:peroxiredoxin
LRKRDFLFALLGLLAAAASSSLLAKEAYLRAWPANRQTPRLLLNDLDGKQWNLADLRGKVVIVNFWATWCEPCVEELQFLNDIASRDIGQGKIAVLGVNYKESASQLRQFSAAHKFAYPILLDKSGEAFKQWAGAVLPTTVLIDRKGKARWRVIGELDSNNNDFRQALEQMLKE